MPLTYADTFRHSDMLNPISTRTLLSAGRLARLGPRKTLLDLGSGKGFPSLFWASTFGIKVLGFDINRNYVEYANSRARLLNLKHQVEYRCRDIRQLGVGHKYEALASLGVGIVGVYGNVQKALESFRCSVKLGGFLFLAEPVWLTRPVPEKLQKELGIGETHFCTKEEMKELLQDCGFQVTGLFVSAKDDWESYVRPVYSAMQEIAKNRPELSRESRKITQSFRAEYRAAGISWDMVLWVAKTRARERAQSNVTWFKSD
jgi:cyclopropane fatty-acyl-phospholipid synthase-like methyltransferase